MAFSFLGSSKSFGAGRITQTSGTVITRLIPPDPAKKTKLIKTAYTSAGTQHTLTIMRPLNQTTVASTAAASQAVVNFTADPGVYTAGINGSASRRTANNVIAAGDFIVFRCPDGTYIVDTVASVATLAITMTTNLPTGGLAAGADIWFFGAIGDTDPNSAAAHNNVLPTVSVQTTYYADGGSIVETFFRNQPILLHSGNATAAGSIDYVSAIYGP